MASRNNSKTLPPSSGPNKAILKILEDEIEQATNRRSSEYYVLSLKKAYKAISKYPLPINSGEEAKVISYVGDKVAQLIDKNLNKSMPSSQPEPIALHPPPQISNIYNPMDELNNFFGKPASSVPKKPGKRTLEQISSMPVLSRSQSTTIIDVDDNSNSSSQISEYIPMSQPQSEHFIKQPYIPKARTGNWAILIALFKHSSPGQPIEVSDLKNLAEPYSKDSMWSADETFGNATHSFTAFSRVKALVDDQLVTKSINPIRYTLTLKGRQLAQELMEKDGADVSNLVSSSQQSQLASSQDNFDATELDLAEPERKRRKIAPKSRSRQKASSVDTNRTDTSRTSVDTSKFSRGDIQLHDQLFSSSCKIPFIPLKGANHVSPFVANMQEVELSQDLLAIPLTAHKIMSVSILVDNRERLVRSGDERYFQNALQAKGANVRTSCLALGDFMWIGTSDTDQDIILDTIVERKTVSDLVGSIIDKRFAEQKWRLRHSGIGNILYLCEGKIEGNESLNGPKGTFYPERLRSALLDTELLHGISVVRTTDAVETINLLSAMTQVLEAKYLNKTVYTTDLEVFKSLKVRHNGATNAEKFEQILLKNSDMLLWKLQQFNEHSDKTPLLPFVDLFGKQIMKCYGLSAEKAGAIVHKFHSMKSLLDAYHQCRDRNHRINIIATIEVAGNSVGTSVATLLHDAVWGKDQD